MKQISMLLDDEEILLLRSGVLMLEFFVPEGNEMITDYKRKILEATNDVGMDVKKQIGMMQRSMRRIRTTPEFAELMKHFQILERMLTVEMMNEEYGRNDIFRPDL